MILTSVILGTALPRPALENIGGNSASHVPTSTSATITLAVDSKGKVETISKIFIYPILKVPRKILQMSRDRDIRFPKA